MKRLGTACSASNLENIRNFYVSTAWKDANDPSDPNAKSSQQFRLVEYLSQPVGTEKSSTKKIGQLVVEGRINPENSDAPGSNKSVTRLAVSFPVIQPDIDTLPIPGVWVGGTTDTDGTGKNNIEADVLINCSIQGLNMSDMNQNVSSNYEIRLSAMQQPDAPSIGAKRYIGEEPYDPDYKANPFDPNPRNMDIPGYISLNAISGKTTIQLPYEGATDTTPSQGQGQGNNNQTTIPSYSDTSNPSEIEDGRFKIANYLGLDQDVYVYQIPSIGAGTGVNAEIKIRPKTKVAIFLQGNISGSVDIICDEDYTPRPNTDDPPAGCEDHNPMNVMIFGKSTADDAEICINGGSRIQAYILAPQYKVGVNGSGSQPGNYQGAVWSKEWGCGSQATGNAALAMKQEGSWTDIPPAIVGSIIEQTPPEINPTGTWEQREASDDSI